MALVDVESLEVWKMILLFINASAIMNLKWLEGFQLSVNRIWLFNLSFERLESVMMEISSWTWVILLEKAGGDFGF